MKQHPDTIACEWRSPLGNMVLAASPLGLCGVWFEGQRHMPDWKKWMRPAPLPADSLVLLLQKTKSWLSQYFEAEPGSWVPAPGIALDLSAGTAFQQAVWAQLLAIAPGETRAYGELATALGAPSAARAVGAAVGRNPVSILVPCHRVLGAGGTLTGYAGGIERKVALLQREGVLM